MRALIMAVVILTAADVEAAWGRRNVEPARAAADPIAAKVSGMKAMDGFIPLHWDEANGKLLMEISRFNQELLYQISLPAGLGSNPIGLDRNQLGGTHVVYFERVGPKVLLVEPNYRFRALSEDERERRSVDESFAKSILWGFKVEAASGARVLVDATSFFLRDAHGVAIRLKEREQGSYALDESRSALYLPNTRVFPANSEVEAILTFTTTAPGELISQVAPSPDAVSVRQHHSFVELPGPGYTPRRFDPRVGSFGIEFYDFASPITDPIEKRWVARHRLRKKDPAAAISEPVEPIVYYLDPGAPEPIRSALLEGASWWNEAFEAAGFRNAFRVRMLPVDADPMDARYNLISWVHRSTRGWSYGGGIVDPRTGEIIKGNVTLGSLRVRQDFLIGSGMVPPYGNCASAPEFDYLITDPSKDSREMSLARIRQLSAHEVGHTLGLDHNFAASTYGRASVMDYPAPWVEIRDGRLDLSNAYARGIGAYDAFAIRYTYMEFSPGADERRELDKVVREGVASGMLFLSDADARPAGAAHPLANLWDNGADPVAALRHEMNVRRIAMAQFGLRSIPEGMPLSILEAKFIPLYLHHRYQLEAAVKTVGGVEYSYSVREGDGALPEPVRRVVPAGAQRDALDAVLDTLDAVELVVPRRILDLIPPKAHGYSGSTIELFAKRTDPIFDPVGTATIAADVAIAGLLNPQRAARLVEQHAVDRSIDGFDSVVGQLIDRVWHRAATDAYASAVMRGVQSLLVERLMQLAANEEASNDVRSIASGSLRELARSLEQPERDAVAASHRRQTLDDIERFLERPAGPWKPARPLPIPAGQPIG